MLSSILRNSRIQRLGILALFAFIISYQVRSSLDTIHVASNLDFFIPFDIQPFSNNLESIEPNIDSRDAIAESFPLRPYSPLHLLAVQHHSFNGMSNYLTQLWNRHQLSIGDDPRFRISLSYSNSRPFEATVAFPHCTCSTASVWTLTQLFFLPPLFCVLLALFAMLRKPGELHVWALAALLLAISQIDLIPHGPGFQMSLDPMAWTDWFRVPAVAYRAFVQCLWKPALIVLITRLFPTSLTVRRYAKWLAVLLTGWSLLQVFLAVAWSEYYVPFVPLHRWLERHNSELTSAVLLSVGVLCFLHHRALGVGAFLLAIGASAVPYLSTRELTSGHEIRIPATHSIAYSQNFISQSYQQFAATVPAQPLTREASVPAFAVSVVSLMLAIEFRRTKRLLSLALLALLPPSLWLISSMNSNIFLWPPSFLVSMLLCTAVGLIGVCFHCLSLPPAKDLSSELDRSSSSRAPL